jgi:hypothetical protein
MAEYATIFLAEENKRRVALGTPTLSLDLANTATTDFLVFQVKVGRRGRLCPFVDDREAE